MFEDFLSSFIIKTKEQNMKEFKSYLNSQAGKTKINNFLLKNTDLPVQNIFEECLKGNPFAIALIRKDVSRQNITEKAFFAYTNLVKLPQSGKNVIKIGASKAADFKINDWLGTQKYIKEAGGAQDNQINDTILFANECLKYNKKHIICIDGDYGKVKINKLLTNNENRYILTADELKAGIENGRFN